MSSGALPKRVVCPTCGAPEGMACRDPQTFKNIKPHPARQAAADAWYVRVSPDGLTPKRRDEMVLRLRQTHRGKVGEMMEKITTSTDPEAEFSKLTG